MASNQQNGEGKEVKNIAIIFTGTVASSLAQKIINAFPFPEFEVNVVLTEKSKFFFDPKTLVNCKVYEDSSEWGLPVNGYVKDAKIPHIELAKENDLLLIIASADFIAKMANGLCDDLASSLYRAWQRHKPVVLAPAMNEWMYSHPIIKEHNKKLKKWGIIIIEPIVKRLACGTYGKGGLEDIFIIKYLIYMILSKKSRLVLLFFQVPLFLFFLRLFHFLCKRSF